MADRLQSPEYIKSDRLQLYLPQTLIPPFSPATLSARIHLHTPVELSLVVLQPVVQSLVGSENAQLDISDLDLTKCCYSSRVIMPNGQANGHNAKQPVPIFRQGETISLPRRHGGLQEVRILTLDPVQQGVITEDTRIVITATPHIADSSPSWSDMDGTISESSHGRTHLSMANFDPDAFLSSSLDLHFHQLSSPLQGSPTLQNEDFGESSHSSTSGSITPRPNGYASHAPPSPPAQVQELAIEDGLETGGKRFNVIIAAGPSSETGGLDADVCWMGVAGLGRAGIFEGDWVRLDVRAATDGQVYIRTSLDSDAGAGHGRLVRALVWERLDEDSPEMYVLV